MYKILLLVYLLSVSVFSYASDINIKGVVGVNSWHRAPYDTLNDNNNLLGLGVGIPIRDNQHLYIEVSYFTNSYYNKSNSYGLGYDIKLINNKPLSLYLGGSVGVVNGYEKKHINSYWINNNYAVYATMQGRVMLKDRVGLQYRVFGPARSVEVVFNLY